LAIHTVRLLSSLNIAIVSFFALLFLPVFQDYFGVSDSRLINICFIIVVTLYGVGYLLEPFYHYWTGRYFPRWETPPSELHLLTYLFKLELKEIVLAPQKIIRPAYPSGNIFISTRLYLQENLKEKLDLSQLKGLFACKLSLLALRQGDKLWAASGGGILFLLTLVYALGFFTFEEEVLSVNLLFSFLPVFLYLMDLALKVFSHFLMFSADLHAARQLVIPDHLVSYLEILDKLEKESETISADAPGKKGSFSSWNFYTTPYPPARERLKKLARHYFIAAEAIKRLNEE